MKTKSETALEQYDSSVQALRTQINLLDEEIIELLKRRLQFVIEAREIKLVEGITTQSSVREQIVLKNVTGDSTGHEKEYLEEVYQALLAATRRIADAEVIGKQSN